MSRYLTRLARRYRWLRLPLHALNYLYLIIYAIISNEISMVAGYLVYSTLLAIVPTVLVFFSVLSFLPHFADIKVALQDIIFGLLAPQQQQDLINVFDNVVAKTSNLGLASVGGLFVVAFLLIRTIDTTVNKNIWKVNTRRRLMQSFTMYWTVISFGPMLLGAMVFVRTYLAGVLTFRPDDIFGQYVILSLSYIQSVVLWFILFFIYTFLPMAKVKYRWGFVSASLSIFVLTAAKNFFVYYINNFASYYLIYGALAAFPITVLWLYVIWMIVLAGAALTKVLSLNTYVTLYRDHLRETKDSDIRRQLANVARLSRERSKSFNQGLEVGFKQGFLLAHSSHTRSLTNQLAQQNQDLAKQLIEQQNTLVVNIAQRLALLGDDVYENQNHIVHSLRHNLQEFFAQITEQLGSLQNQGLQALTWQVESSQTSFNASSFQNSADSTSPASTENSQQSADGTPSNNQSSTHKAHSTNKANLAAALVAQQAALEKAHTELQQQRQQQQLDELLEQFANLNQALVGFAHRITEVATLGSNATQVDLRRLNDAAHKLEDALQNSNAAAVAARYQTQTDVNLDVALQQSFKQTKLADAEEVLGNLTADEKLAQAENFPNAQAEPEQLATAALNDKESGSRDKALPQSKSDFDAEAIFGAEKVEGEGAEKVEDEVAEKVGDEATSQQQGEGQTTFPSSS